MDQKHGLQEKKKERVVNAFETWCWRRMLKINGSIERTKDGEVFQVEIINITFKICKE
jgi:hypothetical protein